MSAAPGVQRVVLLGFMGAGKSVVGRALAARLGWRHLDLDAQIERREGRSVAELFRERGEPAFRALEIEATRALAGERQLVLSPGGGWITNPGVLDALGPGTLSIWLRAAPQTVLRRVGRGARRARRPLLAGPDPAATVAALLAEREPLYARADVHVATDERTVQDIVREIERSVRSRTPASE